MRIAIVINDQRKDTPLLDKKLMDEAAAKYELTYDLFFVKPKEITSTLEQLISQSYNGFLIGGGDGTVRTAVQLLIQYDIPIAVLSLGTFNYFARELGYPNSIDEVFKMLKNNKIKLVDVGEVNHHVFLNHSSIGFYTRIMKMRKQHPQLLKKNKLLKVLFTAFNFFHPLPLFNIRLKLDNKEFFQKICLLVVGNNYHSTDILTMPSSLSMGQLEILILKCQNRWELFKCIIMMLFVNAEQNPYVKKIYSDSLTILTETESINVVIDGDLFTLDVPLNYSINHKQLPVFVP